MEAVDMVPLEIREKIRAIVCFGPALTSTGFRAGDYYQVTIDPNMCSPSGEYIRFGAFKGDEIVGWQRVEAMTVCETLCTNDEIVKAEGYESDPEASVTMRVIE